MSRLFLFRLTILSVAFLVCPMAISLATDTSKSAVEPGFDPIFNGKDLSGWSGKPDVWFVEDGLLTGITSPQKPCKQATYLIWQGQPAGDFELRFSYRLDAGNSGVNFRSRELPGHEIAGYQADIESGPSYTGIIYDVCGRKIMSTRGQKMVVDADGKRHVTQVADAKQLGKKIKSANGWNDYQIIARGNHIVLKINGQLMTELIDNEKDIPRKGTFSLQLHPGPFMKVQYKNIRLKRLD